MAYPAVISLGQTINSLLKSSRFSILSKTLESAYNHTLNLEHLLNGGSERSSERLAALNREIRDCAHQLEDVLEFHELYSDHEEDEEVAKAIASFVETAEKVDVEYIQELSKPVEPQQDDDRATVPSNVDCDVEMVGNSEQLDIILRAIRHRIRPHELWYFMVHGEHGSGRTSVANIIFEELGKEFDCCAWVSIGTKYGLKEVLVQIIAQVDSNQDLVKEEELCNYLCRVLEHRRYMIVLDDVRDVQMVKYLRRSLRNQRNGSIVILTSGLNELIQLSHDCISCQVPAQFLGEIFLSTIRVIFFDGDSVPPELLEAAKKIVENCRCSHISFAKTLLFLSKKEKTLEEWSKIAAHTENPIFIVEDEISERCSVIKETQSYTWNLDDPFEKALVDEILGCARHVDAVEAVKRRISPKRFFGKTRIISLLGMAGIGKTMLARRIFRDMKLCRRFKYEVWVTLGPKYQADEILVDILTQIYPEYDRMRMKEDVRLTHKLWKRLYKKRCLIVLDDLWSKEPLYYLKAVFPHIMGTILVTTRLHQVAIFGEDDIYFIMKLLDTEESWCLLRQKVFGEGFCSAELEIAGRQIAENCDGLPLLIIEVADQLLKNEKTPEFWSNVASGKDRSIFKNAHDQISESLLPSYEILQECLKPCFLYIGAFRNRYEIPISNLTNLLDAEGFLEPNLSQTIEHHVTLCLYALVGRSLVMADHSTASNQIKTCRLHSVYWHLANSEATKNTFFHAMNFYEDCWNDSMMNHRRLCIRKSVLLGMKDVNELMESFKTTRSMLCVGPPHQYQVPIMFNMRLLRVMDALTIRLYEFPVEVVKLVHLRYLGVTCNDNLPPSISSLCKLHYLIVKQYMSIKSSKNLMLLPVEIWDMKELKHLQVVGGCLPNPKCGDGGLPKLTTLLDVSAESCTRKVLKRIPNLKRLGIRIELGPNEERNPFHSLNRISRLRRLESLKCVVVNPQVISEVIAPPPPLSMFPSSLKKLCLSGFGYPWEYMTIISHLKDLEVLKLKHYAFGGPKWVMDYNRKFRNLKYILVDDSDLMHWEMKMVLLDNLKRISIKHCYKLQEIPIAFTHNTFDKIEIVDCNPSVVTWAKKTGQISLHCEFDVNLSWLGSQKKICIHSLLRSPNDSISLMD